MELIEKIVYERATKACNEILSKMDNIPESGYQNIYFGSHAREIGKLFRKNNIPFTSMYDDMKTESEEYLTEISKKYISIYKETPSNKFLCQILSKELQREMLLKVVQKIDFGNCLSGFSNASTVFNILNDFGDVGVDKFYVINEVNDAMVEVLKSNDGTKYMQFNVVSLFVENGFFFSDEVSEEYVKKLWTSTMAYKKEVYFELMKENSENKSVFNYRMLKEFSGIEEKKLDKNKMSKI